MSTYKNLSTRITQVNDVGDRALNRSSETMVVRLGITDGNNRHVDIETTEAAIVPYPYQHPFGAKSMMQTIRIPLACYADAKDIELNFSTVSDITVKFDRTDQGTIAIDDIGFSQ